MAQPDRVEVLIVGAGPTGAIAASELIAAGFSVTCLEQGDWTHRAAFKGATKDWELSAQRDWHPNPNVRGRAADYPIDVTESDVNPLMYAGVGGATILYGAHWVRALPSDFRVRTLDGVADDWPLTYEDLQPFYEDIDQQMGTAGLGDDPTYPDGEAPPLPPLPIGKIGLRAAQGMDQLGWHWWPAPNAIASKAYRGREACVRRGTCQTGCPEGAKGSADLTHWPEAIRAGVRLITGARVAEITVNAQGLADGAVYIDRDGVRHHVAASTVIVAANGVGTPRLLLMSGRDSFDHGLANSSGLVGRRLMMHPYAAVNGVYEEDLESWLGPAGQSIVSHEFYETDLSRGFVRGAKWQVMPAGGPLGNRSGYGGHAEHGDADGEPDPLAAWGPSFHEAARRTFGRSFEWGIIAEDLPDEANRVVLSDSLVDSDGLPAPKIIYKTSENTRRLLDFHLARAREAHLAAGAIETYDTPLMRDCGWHLLGTTRMGDDPETSVVDQYGRSHDIANLYIYDGSTFVTSTGQNPTATIAALTLRAVRHLIAGRRDQEVAS
ncbi:GMC family oxidoreductase [Aeromicrobium tamlense]|uniref:Choline dehydrogenase-like flavoprotein n=1 Tax=Aeromicrobium tamlense TaxID=375541 RepID=A0A8I0FZN0_9ACTN|nr:MULTISPECIES: GMC family oxidoreductase [Aeromicrobium]MBD1272006.1 GMC family oxidoreductase [Aeromicrobium tamlense]NYI38802.1 choline dehydrogenase-like flavoprotein [Aeromicrobium tamlense]